VDGTFKVTREPFLQVFSVHAFVNKSEQLQQLPLVFVVMSRRRAVDYRAVFEAPSCSRRLWSGGLVGGGKSATRSHSARMQLPLVQRAKRGSPKCIQDRRPSQPHLP